MLIFFANFPHRVLNKCVQKGKFPSCLKQADITPVFKKASRNSKDNYRPVSILTNVSKIFEKLLFKQMSNDFFDKFLSMYQRDFRKGFSDQHCLVLCLKNSNHPMKNKNHSELLWQIFRKLLIAFLVSSSLQSCMHMSSTNRLLS